MNEKKNNGFAALILSVIVVAVAVCGVKFAGGTAASAVKPGPGPVVTPGEDDTTPAGKYGAGTYTATAQGMGKVTVTVTVDENQILSIDLDVSGETPGLGDKGAQKAVENILAAQSADVDTTSGATISSTAVINAVKDALAQAEAAAGSSEGGAAAGLYKAGTYTATAQGMGKVTVTVTVDENQIVNIELDVPGETPGLGDKGAQKAVESILSAQSADVATISGATISSTAVINAVADALAQAAN